MNLGDFTLKRHSFEKISEVFKLFSEDAFKALNEHQKSLVVNGALLKLIQSSASSFLLDAVIEFMEKVLEEKILELYNFSLFEIYLNQYSNLSSVDNYRVRGKIMGKSIPREEYQAFFPIGMSKTYPGTHFVTAHSSPDLDTTVASFWGWVDAFSAQVGDGIHIWNVPGGPPTTQIEIGFLFNEIFGNAVFDCLAKTRESLTITSLDLMTQKGMMRKETHELTLSVDHDRQHHAIVLVDSNGYYLGDWRHFDVEGVRQIISSLNNCLRWLESHIHMELISLFAKKNLTADDLSKFIDETLQKKLQDYRPAGEFNLRQEKYLQDYLIKVLLVEKGIESTFEDLISAMENFPITEFNRFFKELQSLKVADLFDEKGKLIENRPLIFSHMEKLVKYLAESFQSLHAYVDRLEVAFKIKTDVFGHLPQDLTQRTDLEEILTKIDSYPYLTVNYLQKSAKKVPIGVIFSSKLQRKSFGTVTLRDFCNREEMKIPSYLDVISIIDHHKASLQTMSPPMALISDAQSSNALVAKLNFAINDKYSLGGMTADSIEKQLEEAKKNSDTPTGTRILQRLLQKKMVSASPHDYLIDSKREFVEYLHFIYAILDDTDLLTKVTRMDLSIIASLLNRMKTITTGIEQEIVHFDDLAHDATFDRVAAKALLQNEDFYSLYDKIYRSKEEAMDENLSQCGKGKSKDIFADTKTLNQIFRISQTKLFAKNHPIFDKHASGIRKNWQETCLDFYEDHLDVDVYVHMLSTIASAEELYQEKELDCPQKDELWFWIPNTEAAIAHLKLFLNSFRRSERIQGEEMEVEFVGENAEELSLIFKESFVSIAHTVSGDKKGPPHAILRYRAGLLNSRKAYIAPYLPSLAK